MFTLAPVSICNRIILSSISMWALFALSSDLLFIFKTYSRSSCPYLWTSCTYSRGCFVLEMFARHFEAKLLSQPHWEHVFPYAGHLLLSHTCAFYHRTCILLSVCSLFCTLFDCQLAWFPVSFQQFHGYLLEMNIINLFLWHMMCCVYYVDHLLYM